MVPRHLIVFALLAAAVPAGAVESLDIAIGKALFERNWVPAPSSTQADDGLGPFYDAPSCASCHAERPSFEVDDTTIVPGTIIRLGTANGTGDPTYGDQLQTRTVSGLEPEVIPDIQWTPMGELRVATITPYRLNYGELASGTKMGLRRAPALAGVGLIAQIPESEIVRRADPDDADGDGISGRAAYVTVNGQRVLGRFGWKATQPDLSSQTAMAFFRDIGLSTGHQPEAWGDCTAAQAQCRAAPQGARPGEPEIADAMVKMIADFVAGLRAPTPGPLPATGAAIFAGIGCFSCHTTLNTADGRVAPVYSDLLLHDMGDDLNDGIKEGAAEPGEWRTAPLSGVAADLKLRTLLHDGRARSVAEAVEWHGGEAAASRARFRALSAADREALVAFVSGL